MVFNNHKIQRQTILAIEQGVLDKYQAAIASYTQNLNSAYAAMTKCFEVLEVLLGQNQIQITFGHRTRLIGKPSMSEEAVIFVLVRHSENLLVHQLFPSTYWLAVVRR